MKTKYIIPLFLLSATIFLVPLDIRSADLNADNSGNNSADNRKDAVTPERQSNASEDVAVTRTIRKAITKDSSLSLYAHNIKIITTKEHVVYLRGTVSSSDDLAKITALADQNANGYPVKNQLTVTPK